MASVALQPVPAIRDALAANPVPVASAVNANQEQAQATPQDTVTLTTQGAEAQQTEQQAPQPQTQPNPAPLIPDQASNGNNAGLNQLSPQGNTAQPQGMANQTGTASPAAASPAAVADPNNGASSVTPQELDQLYAMLQQLGINAQSLSPFALEAMIPYLSDPAALLAYVQQLPGVAPQPTQEPTTNSTLASAQPAGVSSQVQAFQATLATINAAPETATSAGTQGNTVNVTG